MFVIDGHIMPALILVMLTEQYFIPAGHRRAFGLVLCGLFAGGSVVVAAAGLLLRDRLRLGNTAVEPIFIPGAIG